MKKVVLTLLLASTTLSFTFLEYFESSESGVPCETVYTVCDNAHPENYDLFIQCMENNGCGGDEETDI